LDLIEFISQFSELRCERYWFFEDIVAINSKKCKKLGLEGKMSWALNMFTLEPTTQATLVGN
jgi:uncharacterized CHY-type Zn-finger protein